MNPVSGLLHSRKFWILILDTVLALAALYGSLYLAPDKWEVIAATFGIIQPVFVAVIYGIFSEDNAQRAMDTAIAEADAYHRDYTTDVAAAVRAEAAPVAPIEVSVFTGAKPE